VSNRRACSALARLSAASYGDVQERRLMRGVIMRTCKRVIETDLELCRILAVRGMCGDREAA